MVPKLCLGCVRSCTSEHCRGTSKPLRSMAEGWCGLSSCMLLLHRRCVFWEAAIADGCCTLEI